MPMRKPLRKFSRRRYGRKSRFGRTKRRRYPARSRTYKRKRIARPKVAVRRKVTKISRQVRKLQTRVANQDTVMVYRGKKCEVIGNLNYLNRYDWNSYILYSKSDLNKYMDALRYYDHTGNTFSTDVAMKNETGYNLKFEFSGWQSIYVKNNTYTPAYTEIYWVECKSDTDQNPTNLFADDVKDLTLNANTDQVVKDNEEKCIWFSPLKDGISIKKYFRIKLVKAKLIAPGYSLRAVHAMPRILHNIGSKAVSGSHTYQSRLKTSGFLLRTRGVFARSKLDTTKSAFGLSALDTMLSYEVRCRYDGGAPIKYVVLDNAQGLTQFTDPYVVHPFASGSSENVATIYTPPVS